MRGVAAATPETRGRRSTPHTRSGIEFSPVGDEMTAGGSSSKRSGHHTRADLAESAVLGDNKGAEQCVPACTPVKRWWGQPKLEHETCLTSPVTSVLLGGPDACAPSQAGGEALSSSPGLTPHQGMGPGHTPQSLGRGIAAPKVSKRRGGCRQDCSLFKLTHRFLELVFKTEDGLLDLNSVADSLGVKKRRIYDITNVLEGVGIIEKQGKNHIRWKGMVEAEPLNAQDSDSGTPSVLASRRKRSRGMQTRTEENSGLDSVETQIMRGTDLAADQEILRLREQLVELEKMDRLLDEQVRVLRDNLRRLSSSEKIMRHAYLTGEDILSLSVFQKHMVIAVQAPPGTELLWGDEPTRKQNGPNTAVYHLQVCSSGGAIECYLLSAGAGGGAHRGRCTMPLSDPEQTSMRIGSFPAHDPNGRLGDGGRSVAEDSARRTAIAMPAQSSFMDSVRDFVAGPWQMSAAHRTGRMNTTTSKHQVTSFVRRDVPGFSTDEHSQPFAGHDQRVEENSAVSIEDALHAGPEDFEIHSQSMPWSADTIISAPGSPGGSERTLEAISSVIGLTSPLRSTVVGTASPMRPAAVAYIGQDGIRPVPMRRLVRESTNADSSWSNTYSTERTGSDNIYAANTLDNTMAARINLKANSATGTAASSPERAAAAASHAFGMNGNLAVPGTNVHLGPAVTIFKENTSAPHTLPPTAEAMRTRVHSPTQAHGHSNISANDGTDDFHGELISLYRQQERALDLRPGTVSPGGTLKFRRASPYVSPLRDSSQRFSPFRKAGTMVAPHLDSEMDGSFGSILPSVFGAFTRSPSPPIIQDFAVESLLLDHTRERGGGLMDLFVSVQHDPESPLS
jgi:hypothetical protein